ncbi:MAG: PEP-CTERM sorting domain-containing protein [Planctomycetia bacterium]|nr:PEP-CTERM sorting domain-containing protein [Planctomycetia bacterium]
MQKICQITMFLLFTWGMGNGISAVEVTWNNSSGVDNLWSNANNWSSGQVPTTGDTVIINNGGTVDLGTLTAITRLQGEIKLSNGSIVADVPVTTADPKNTPFMVIEDSFTMTGGTVNINVRRFLLGTNGTTVSTISGGSFTYRHEGGLEDGSMRVGSLWGNAVPTATPNVDATLNIQGNVTVDASRMVVGFGGWSNKTVAGTVVVEDTANLILGADAKNGDPDQPNKMEYALVVGQYNNGTGNIVVKGSGTLTTQGRISIGQEKGEGTLTLQDSGTIQSVELRTGVLGCYVQTGGNATFTGDSTRSGDFMVNSVKNNSVEYGMVVSGGSLTVNGTLHVGQDGGASGTALVSGGTFDLGTLSIRNYNNGTSSLTIQGGESQWTVGTFQMPNASELLFEFGKGGYATIATTNTASLANGAKVSATFDFDRIQIVQDHYDLITASKMSNGGAVLYHNTDYWKILQEGQNIVLTRNNFFDGIPDFPVSEGVIDLVETGDTIEFYTDIFNPEEMEEFLKWLEEAKDVFSAEKGDDGSVIVKFVEELDYFAFDFDMNGRPVYISHSPIMQVPEPATWGMFLMGLAGIYFLRKRRLRKNA